MKIYGDNCPCKGCNERTIECHSKCEKYRQWVNNGFVVDDNKWFSNAKQKWYYQSIHNKAKRNK